MEKLLAEINSLRFAITGVSLKENEIQAFQNELEECGFPPLPEIVISLLKIHNGILIENRCVWGINSKNHFKYDILGENALAENPNPEELLLLGSTETTFIAYKKSSNSYSMIDKSDLSVIHEFENFQNAVRYILKIDD